MQLAPQRTEEVNMATKKKTTAAGNGPDKIVAKAAEVATTQTGFEPGAQTAAGADPDDGGEPAQAPAPTPDPDEDELAEAAEGKDLDGDFNPPAPTVDPDKVRPGDGVHLILAPHALKNVPRSAFYVTAACEAVKPGGIIRALIRHTDVTKAQRVSQTQVEVPHRDRAAPGYGGPVWY